MVGSIQLNGSKISIASDESDEYLSPMSMRASTVNSQKRPSLLVTTLVRRASVSPTTPPGMLSNRASTVGSPPPAGLEVDDDLIDNINFRPSRVSMNRRPSVRSPLSVTASNTNDDDDDDDSDVEGQKDEETVQSKVEPATTERTSITKPSQFSNTPKHESTSKSSQRPETNQSSKDLYKQPSSSSLQNKVKTPLRSSSNQSLSKDQPPLRSSSSESLKLTGRIKSVPSLASGQQSKLSSRTQSRDSLIPLESINSAFFGPKTRKSPSPLNKTESTENVAADNKISSNKELNESKPHSRASSIKKASSIQVSLNSTRHNSKEVLPLSVLSRSSSSASMHSTNHTSNKEKSSITHSRPTSRINSISAKPPTSKPSGTHSPTVRASQVGAPSRLRQDLLLLVLFQ
ncbi:hypothetical protein BCR33DRAFT_128582 [Rhizoclosmatium globosum]|uniref:Uncharacterized protein n=1 Tax=Rhizoclosmatium globosum TaxID=329046 RepID=A0A1Y2CHD1_9FUNG|nr:hypothetical protein BCR33DRAFT_128582 [Rhizoclosmatium globosum]|eukprot:ORY46439.1 hypothetical protein BCR33DRAFT_128582 [Rhizoclosmatium globosum]